MIFEKLQKSGFRSSFHLSVKDKFYIKEKGLDKIKEHSLDFLNKRIKIKPKNDGKQTPFKGHPVFIAMHATASCCRKCIEKWHGFPKDKELTDKEIDYLSGIIMKWIGKELN